MLESDRFLSSFGSISTAQYLSFEEGNRIGMQMLALLINKEKNSKKLVLCINYVMFPIVIPLTLKCDVNMSLLLQRKVF